MPTKLEGHAYVLLADGARKWQVAQDLDETDQDIRACPVFLLPILIAQHPVQRAQRFSFSLSPYYRKTTSQPS